MFCFPYIYESFINFPSEFKVDVYVHTRKSFRALPLYTPTSWVIDSFSSNDLLQKMNNLSLSPELKTQQNLYSEITLNSNSILNQLLMLDGIQKSFYLSLSNNKQYDIYIRCRPDIFTDSQLRTISIIGEILNGEHDIFIPSKNFKFGNFDYNKSQNQYNDQLAIGNFKGIEAYSNTLNNLEYLVSQTKELKAENWIKKQLDYHNIKVKSSPFPINLIRDLQVVSNRGTFGKPDVLFLDK